MLLRVHPSRKQNLAKVEALLDHLVTQPNVAPFFARRMIQRFGFSNPTADYLSAVAEAFRTGHFGTEVFSGESANRCFNHFVQLSTARSQLYRFFRPRRTNECT